MRKETIILLILMVIFLTSCSQNAPEENTKEATENLLHDTVIECPVGQLKHQGFCKPKIIELNDDYTHPEAYLSEYMASGVNDTTTYNFNYPLLVQKTQELTRGLSTNQDKLLAIANWVHTSKYYQFGASEEEGLSTLWNNQYGVCNHAARITVAMLNKAGIPALFFFLPLQNHAATIYNVDGIWGPVDTTFQLPNTVNREIQLESIEFQKSKVYLALDPQGLIFNDRIKQYCNYKNMVCSDKPFNSLKIFIHPSIQTTGIFYPAEQKIIIPESIGGSTKFSYSCSLKINNISCFANGCSYNFSFTVFDLSQYNPPFSQYNHGSEDYMNPFSYEALNYLENQEPVHNIGYIHLKMPKYRTLSYDYTCVNSGNLGNGKVIATKKGSLDVSSQIIIKWNNLEKSDGATPEEYDELKNHFKSLTDDLNIFP